VKYSQFIKMDSLNYKNLIIVLNRYPTTKVDIDTFEFLQKQSKYFLVRNNNLYKLDKRSPNNLLKVLQKHELFPVLYIFHNDPTAAHFAVDNMFEKIRNRYYWPQMYEDIRKYVQSCDSCQKRGKNRKNQKMHPIPVGDPFYQIGIDFVGPLPITERGNRYIIVAMDYLTKWPEAKAVPSATAEQVANFLYEDIIGRHGCPHKILSDQGTHFKNKMIAKLLEKFQIQQKFSTPYHPQTNGLVERFNKTLCGALAKLTYEHQKDWDLFISPVLFAYRTSKHSTTQMTPFYLLYGREAKLPIDAPVEIGSLQTRVETLIDNLPLDRELVKEQIKTVQDKQKQMYDKQIRHEYQFSAGEKVLYYKAPMDNQHSGKLLPKWKGPYYIHETCGNGAYRIRSADGKVIKSPVNGVLLKPYFEYDFSK